MLLPALLLLALARPGAGSACGAPGRRPGPGRLCAHRRPARPSSAPRPWPCPSSTTSPRPWKARPKPANWLPSGGALVNNRLALQPLTRGTATLDGLRANGQSYSGLVTSAYGALDSLTSQPINLAGLTTNDQVYLSFAWQAGSIVGVPNASGGTHAPCAWSCCVKTNTGIWEQAWIYNSLAPRAPPFRQQVIDLNQAKYLHGDFQFRFVASGNPPTTATTGASTTCCSNRGRRPAWPIPPTWTLPPAPACSAATPRVACAARCAASRPCRCGNSTPPPATQRAESAAWA